VFEVFRQEIVYFVLTCGLDWWGGLKI